MNKECPVCSDSFQVSKAEAKRGNGKFCSRSCSATNSNALRPKGKGKKKLTYRECKERYGERFFITDLVQVIRRRARDKGIPFDITIDDIHFLLKCQKGRCYYTGRKLVVEKSSRKEFNPDQMSVDRKVPRKGYVDDNVVLCCRWVNSAKGQMNIKELMKRAKELVDFNS